MSTFSNQGSSIDCFIRSGTPDTVYSANAVVFIGTYSGSVDRVLLKWDLSSIPASAVVSSATLSLWAASDDSSNERTLSAYRVLQNWVDGQATWNSYSTGNSWATAGCSNTTTDREAADIGSQTIPAVVSQFDRFDITLTAAKVQEWISGVLTNNGLLLKVDTEANDMIGYYSSNEAVQTSYRFQLVIEYTSGLTQPLSDSISIAESIGTDLTQATINYLKFYRRTRFPKSITGR